MAAGRKFSGPLLVINIARKMNQHHKRMFATPLPDFDRFQVNLNGQPLTAAQARLFEERCQQLQKGNCRVVYRGDRKGAVARRFGLEPAQIPGGFNDRLFLIGPKGRHFWRAVAEQGTANTASIDIADASDTVFGRIFDMLQELLTVQRFSPGVQAAIDRFKDKEPNCAQFFSLKKNKKILVKSVRGLPNRPRIRIRDYYLTLLHHMGASEFYPVSFLLSATLSWEVAWQFSTDARQKQDEIIFIGWVPWGVDTILHTFRFGGGWGRPDLMDQLGLPRYHRSFFPRQREVTLKGGLLAHYTLGYYHTHQGQQTFEVNPYLFQIANDHWIKDGLPVNQRNFYQELSQTEYQRAYILLEQTGEFRGLP